MEGAKLLNFYNIVPNKLKGELIYLLMERDKKGNVKTFNVPIVELEQFAPEGESFNFAWIYVGAISSMVYRQANTVKMTSFLK